MKYKDIHGENKTTFLRHGEHVSPHRKLRKENKCNIPSKELRKISIKSYHDKIRDLRKEIDERVKRRVLCIRNVY